VFWENTSGVLDLTNLQMISFFVFAKLHKSHGNITMSYTFYLLILRKLMIQSIDQPCRDGLEGRNPQEEEEEDILIL